MTMALAENRFAATDIGEILAREFVDDETGIPGWCTVEKGARMAALASGASLCVELGVFGGRGLVAMALGLREQGFGRADGIDPYTPGASLEGINDKANNEWWERLDYEAIADRAQQAICELGLLHFARLIRMRSADIARYYAPESVDLLHQDSNHSEEVSCDEVARWAPKIRPGGYWILDDADWSTTQKAQRLIESFDFKLVEDHERWKVYRKP